MRFIYVLFYVLITMLFSLDSIALAQVITYTYDTCPYGIGRLCSVTDLSGSESVTYDVRGNLARTNKIIDSATYTIQRNYDSLNRPVDLTYPDGEIVRHSYNAQGMLNSIQSLTYGTNYVSNLDYNVLGQMTLQALGDGKTTTYSYADAVAACPRNNNFRLCSIVTSGLQNLTLAYDYVGNVTGVTDTIGAATQTFAYDTLSRLTWASSPSAPTYVHSYGYDAIGNLTSAAGKTYTYPPAGAPHLHAPTADGTNSYQYDANGNMNSKTTGSLIRTFTWNADNRLSKITDGTTDIATFAYDYAGARVKKTAGINATIYIGKLYECVGGSCSKYIFAGDRRIANRQVGSTTINYYHADHLGSTSVVTGALSQTLTYFPYGQTRVNSLGGESGVTHKFTGQELDAVTGLYDYGARYYDPALMRFISADPIGVRRTNPQTLNRYSYALNNPLRYIDPTGNQAETPCGIGCTIMNAVFSWFGTSTQPSNVEVYGPPSPDMLNQISATIAEMKQNVESSGLGKKMPLLQGPPNKLRELLTTRDIQVTSVENLPENVPKDRAAYYVYNPKTSQETLYIIKENYGQLSTAAQQMYLFHEGTHAIFGHSERTQFNEMMAIYFQYLYASQVLGLPSHFPDLKEIQQMYPGAPP